MRLLLASVLLLIGFTLVGLCTLPVPTTWNLPILLVGALLVTQLTFMLTDRFIPDPSPKELSMEGVKQYLKSKIFWLAVLNFIIANLDGAFGIVVSEDIKLEILELDWTKIVQSLISVVIIVIRKFDVLKVLM